MNGAENTGGPTITARDHGSSKLTAGETGRVPPEGGGPGSKLEEPLSNEREKWGERAIPKRTRGEELQGRKKRLKG